VKALLPLSWAYAAGVAVDRALRTVPRAPGASRPRVVSIGNLETGGSGKTPLAIWWLARAAEDGARVAYVSRGYGARAVGAHTVTGVLPGDVLPVDAAGWRVLARSHPELAREIGDEGALVVERAPGAAALFCADKRRAVAAAAALGVDVVVLDDGFQSWRVARNTDVVMLDAARPLDGGALLPAGTLREAPSALRRADAVVFNGASSEDALQNARARVARWLRDGIPVAGMARSLSFAAVGAGAQASPWRLVAVSAIARPEAFARSLADAGVVVAAHLMFRDHHRYDAKDVARIAARAAREDAEVVTTEKDWVKLRGLELPARVWVARLEVALIGDPLPV
jgi:tetraacyldisaccharide 4'-kinase